jgi:hypothetical protein
MSQKLLLYGSESHGHVLQLSAKFDLQLQLQTPIQSPNCHSKSRQVGNSHLARFKLNLERLE